jgi:dihydrofolate reductase
VLDKVLDKIQIHLIPVLLGEGRRLFDHLGAESASTWGAPA